LRRLNDDLWPVPPSTNAENNISIPPQKKSLSFEYNNSFKK
jgi:hypothetical protein